MPEMRDEIDRGHADQKQQTGLRVSAVRAPGNPEDRSNEQTNAGGGLGSGHLHVDDLGDFSAIE